MPQPFLKQQSCCNQRCCDCFKNFLQFLGHGIVCQSVPVDLESASAHRLAQTFNSSLTVPEPGFPSTFECRLMSHLSPPLFIRYLRLRGGILEMRRSCASIDFQRVVKRLFEVAVDYKHLSLRHRRVAFAEVRALRKKIRKGDEIDHSFQRLGLRVTELTAHEREMETPEACSGMYRFLQEFYDIQTGLSMKHHFFPLSDCLLVFPELNNFTMVRQQRFQTVTTAEDVKKAKRTWNCDRINLHTKVYLVAMETAISKGRFHVATLLAMSILLDGDISKPATRNFKIFVYSTLAYSLSCFNYSIDLPMALVNKMLSCLVYPSDYQLFLLSKQRILSSYGLCSRETDLFETAYRSDPFLKQSVQLRQFLATHSTTVMRKCFAWILEIWCSRMEDLSFGNVKSSKKLKANSTKIFNKIYHRCCRLSEIMTPYRESRSVFRGTLKIVRMCDARIKMMRGIVAEMTGNRVEATRIFNLLIGEVTGIYGSIFAAYVRKESRADHLWTAEMKFLAFVNDLQDETDFRLHPRVGIKAVEILSVVLGLGMGLDGPSFVSTLIQNAKASLLIISKLQPHWCSSLVERVQKNVLNDANLKTAVGQAIGETTRQVNTCLRQASHKAALSGALEACRLEDPSLLSFFDTRDGQYLSEIVSFGMQSIQLRKGVRPVVRE